MSTSKPISTISYNTPEYLTTKLNQLVKGHTIQNWMFIEHKPDTDNTKKHIHVYVEPNKRIDPMGITDELKELDPKQPDKPLGCISWRPCNSLDDWILYCLHIPAYLQSKGQDMKIQYKTSDFRYANELQASEDIQHALNYSNFATRSKAIDMLLDDDVNPVSLIKTGMLPLQSAGHIRSMLQMNADFQQKLIDKARRSHKK